MHALMAIAKREFRSYFDAPLAYVVICISYLGFGLAFFYLRGGFFQVDRASMALLFDYLPWGLLLVTSVVTMRLVAEEKRSGTFEMLITLPVKDSDVVLGKYFGALGLTLAFVLATLAYPVVMFRFPWNLGPLDWNSVWSGYLGLTLFTAAAVAIGLLVSSLAESQAVAFFITLFTLGIVYYVGDVAEDRSDALGAVLSFISFKSRFEGFARGLIDTRDVVFFVSVTCLALVFAFRALERRKWA